MLECTLNEKSDEIEKQATALAALQKEHKAALKSNETVQKAYNNLEKNHNRLKDAKKKLVTKHKLEMNTLQFEHNEMVGESGGTKRTLRGQRAETLAHENLTKSINDLRTAIKNMMNKRSDDNKLIIQKLRKIDDLNKEIKEKDKKIAELDAMLAAQKYDAQKFCAEKRAQSSENTYKAAKERRMKSKEEHERKEQSKKSEHDNKLAQANHSSKLKVNEKAALLKQRADHLREFGKSTKTKNDLHIRTGRFSDVASELDDSMPLLSNVLGGVVENDTDDIVQKYARRLKKKRDEKVKSVAARVTPNKKQIPRGQFTLSQFGTNDNNSDSDDDKSDDSSDGPELIRTLAEARRAIVPGWIAKFDDESKSYYFQHLGSNTTTLQSPRDLENLLKGKKKRKKRKSVTKKKAKKARTKAGFKTTGLEPEDEIRPIKKRGRNVIIDDTDDDDAVEAKSPPLSPRDNRACYDTNAAAEAKSPPSSPGDNRACYDTDEGSSKNMKPDDDDIDAESIEEVEATQLPSTQKLEDMMARKEIDRLEMKVTADEEQMEKEKKEREEENYKKKIDEEIIKGINDGNDGSDSDTI